jgi:hypothetical protein
MLICSNASLVAALWHWLANTEMWSQADGEALHGELQLQAVVLCCAEHRASQLAAELQNSKVGCTDVLQLIAWRQHYDLYLATGDFSQLLVSARQQDCLLFIDDAAPGHETAQLQLLLAEALHAALPLTAKPLFIQCQLDLTPADWPGFYQQLDCNIRWQRLISCRWLLATPDADWMFQQDPAHCSKQHLDWLAGQIYLLLLASLPAQIGPDLNDFEQECNNTRGETRFQDWRVLPVLAKTGQSAASLVSFKVPSASDCTSDLRLTQISVSQGSLLDDSPQLNCTPQAHHLLSRIRVCLQQLPPSLPFQHLLLMQRPTPRPQWQLQGYWRLLIT